MPLTVDPDGPHCCGMQLDLDALRAGLDEICRSPADNGKVELIVRRPAENEREILSGAYLDTAVGLIGDGWLSATFVKGCTRTCGVVCGSVAVVVPRSRVRRGH
jgi:hypothetical protein